MRSAGRTLPLLCALALAVMLCGCGGSGGVTGLGVDAAAKKPPPPSGEKIAFHRSGSIYTMDTSGGNYISLATGALPDRHPQAVRIAYENGKCIWVMEDNGANQAQVTTSAPYGPPDYVSEDWAPDWSPAY